MSELQSLDLSGAIGKIMEHPELISMVSSILGDTQEGAQKPPSEQSSAEAPPSVPAEVPESIATLMPMLSKISSLGSGGKPYKHEALLCALKPYLCATRCEAIDYIIKISKMTSLVRDFK